LADEAITARAAQYDSNDFNRYIQSLTT